MVLTTVQEKIKEMAKIAIHRGVFKVVVMGETGVGKTSLITRATKGFFPDPELLKSTIGASFALKRVSITDENSNISAITLQIWDFAGQERFRTLLKGFIAGALGGLFVFDLTDPVTLDDIKNYWIPEVEERLDIKFSENPEFARNFVLVGNKSDLIKDRQVTYEEILEVAKPHNLKYILVSSKTGENVERLFEVLAHQLYKTYIVGVVEK